MGIYLGLAILFAAAGIRIYVAAVNPQSKPRRRRRSSLYEVGGVVAGAWALHDMYESHQRSQRIGHDIERAQHLAALDAPFGTFEYYQAQRAHLHHYR